MSPVDQVILDAFFYVVVPAMLAAIIYMYTLLPHHFRDTAHRVAVIGLLCLLLFAQYRMWSAITEISEQLDSIPTRITDAQRKASTDRLRQELETLRQFFGL